MSTKSTTPDISSPGDSMPVRTTPKPTMQKTTILDRETTEPTIPVLISQPPSTQPPASNININIFLDIILRWKSLKCKTFFL